MYKILIAYNHMYVSGSHAHFPCKVNLSNFLLNTDIKNEITTSADINVYDVAYGSYVDVYIDLDKTNNKLLIYFDGAINDSIDKTFYAIIKGGIPSVNSTSVYFNYYQRAWGMNSYDNTPTTDLCLATSTILNKNSCAFGNDALFYKGGKGETLGVYATSTYVPCLVSAQQFSFHLQIECIDYVANGLTFYFRQAQTDNYAININTSVGNRLYLVITNGPTIIKLAYIDVSSWVIGEFYDVFFVCDLAQVADTDKFKAYVNGYQVFVTYITTWSGLTVTSSVTPNIRFLNEPGYTNPSVVDFFGVLPTNIDADFILTSANQYKKTNFWTIKLIDNSLNLFKKSYVIDSGIIYINYGEKGEFKLGNTCGDSQFGLDKDIRYMSFDGERNDVKKTHRLVGVTPKIIANMTEINYRLLNLILPGSDVYFNDESYLIERKLCNLLSKDYIKNVSIVGELVGTNYLVAFKLLESISIESVETDFINNDELVIECTFVGCFTRQNNTTEPWEIEFLTED